jgi:hypothetical protein
MREDILAGTYLTLTIISALVPVWALRKNDFPDPYPIIWLTLFIVGSFFSLVFTGLLNVILIQFGI